MRTFTEGWTAQRGFLDWELTEAVAGYPGSCGDCFLHGAFPDFLIPLLKLAFLPTGVPEGRDTDEGEREKPTPPAPVPGKPGDKAGPTVGFLGPAFGDRGARTTFRM